MNTDTNRSNILRFPQSSDALPIGQIVAYSDMANPRQEAAVLDLGDGRGQRCLFADGHASTVRRSYIEGPGGWELVPRVLTADELAAWQFDAAGAKLDRENQAKRAKEAQAIADEKERARLLSEFPKLERQQGSKKSGHALAAANIKRLLAREFPGQAFKVTSKSYSGGNSVDVHWTDGPTTEEVDAIIKRFTQGSFDGMTDCYEYSRSVWGELFGSAKYVHGSRNVSEARMREVADEMGYAGHALKWGSIEGVDHGTNEAFRRRYWARSFYGKPAAVVTPPAPVNPFALHTPCLCW